MTLPPPKKKTWSISVLFKIIFSTPLRFTSLIFSKVNTKVAKSRINFLSLCLQKIMFHRRVGSFHIQVRYYPKKLKNCKLSNKYKTLSMHPICCHSYFWVGAIMPTPTIQTPTISTQFLLANNANDSNRDVNIDSNYVKK